MSYQQIVLNNDILPIKTYIDDILKIDCCLVPRVLVKRNGNFGGLCLNAFKTNKETASPLLIIWTEERKYIYDEVNIYNNNIEFNTEVKRTKTKFINDSNIIRLLEEMVIECKNTLRKTK